MPRRRYSPACRPIRSCASGPSAAPTGRRTTSSYGEFAEMVRAAHALITGTRGIDGSEMNLPEANQPAGIDVAELKGRADNAAQELRRTSDELAAWLAASADASLDTGTLAARSLLAIRDQRRRASVVSGCLERGPRGAVRASARRRPSGHVPHRTPQHLGCFAPSRVFPQTKTRGDTTWRGCRLFSASRSSSFRCSSQAMSPKSKWRWRRAPTFKMATRWRWSPGIRGPAACERAWSASRPRFVTRTRCAPASSSICASRSCRFKSPIAGWACPSKPSSRFRSHGSRSSSSRRRRSTCIARWPACSIDEWVEVVPSATRDHGHGVRVRSTRCSTAPEPAAGGAAGPGDQLDALDAAAGAARNSRPRTSAPRRSRGTGCGRPFPARGVFRCQRRSAKP